MNGMQRFGQLIQRGRERRGLLGKVLAPRVGLGPSTLSDYENGSRKNLPDPSVLDALQRELGISKREMLEAWGYLDPEERDGDTITITASDPRAEVLAVLDGLPDRDVLKARMILEVLVDHAAPVSDVTESHQDRDNPQSA